jgi:hypothetical protein
LTVDDQERSPSSVVDARLPANRDAELATVRKRGADE